MGPPAASCVDAPSVPSPFPRRYEPWFGEDWIHTMSSLPSRLRSVRDISDGDDVSANVVAAPKPPVPLPNATATEYGPPEGETDIARSSFPSRFTSPSASQRWPVPAVKAVGAPNPPEPLPRNTETVVWPL